MTDSMFKFTLVTPATRVISYEEARDLAAKVVQDAGENHSDVYGGRYFDSAGAPSCLVGAMLYEQGVSAAEVQASHANGAAIGGLEQMGILIPADHKTKLFLGVLQQQNDSGVPWGKAFKAALAAVGDEVRPAFTMPKSTLTLAEVKEANEAWMEYAEEKRPPVPMSVTSDLDVCAPTATPALV